MSTVARNVKMKAFLNNAAMVVRHSKLPAERNLDMKKRERERKHSETSIAIKQEDKAQSSSVHNSREIPLQNSDRVSTPASLTPCGKCTAVASKGQALNIAEHLH